MADARPREIAGKMLARCGEGKSQDLAIRTSHFRERLRGVEIKTSDAQSLARMIREDTIRWAKVIRDFDVKPEN